MWHRRLIMGFFHPYCDGVEVMEKRLLPLPHVEAHRARESVAQLHLQKIWFRGTFFGSHILSVSNICHPPKPSNGCKAPLLTSLRTLQSCFFLLLLCVFLSPREGRGTMADISTPKHVPTGGPSPGVKQKKKKKKAVSDFAPEALMHDRHR